MRVSAVIPTTGRDTLFSAVASALRQSHPVCEVLVVADTVSPLHLPRDSRVRVERVGPGAGGNAARKRGLELCQGDVVALLDDDDVWHSTKLEAQLAAVEASNLSAEQPWIVSSRVKMVAGDAKSRVLPRVPIGPHEDYARHIFELRSIWLGKAAFLQSSTLVFPKWLGVSVPFGIEVRVHQDLAWVLDVRRRYPETPILQLRDVLVDYLANTGGMTRRMRFRESIEWGQRHLSDQSARVRGDFMLTAPVRAALGADNLRGLFEAVGVGMRFGSPSPRAYFHASLCLVKLEARRLVRLLRGNPQ